MKLWWYNSIRQAASNHSVHISPGKSTQLEMRVSIARSQFNSHLTLQLKTNSSSSTTTTSLQSMKETAQTQAWINQLSSSCLPSQTGRFTLSYLISMRPWFTTSRPIAHMMTLNFHSSSNARVAAKVVSSMWDQGSTSSLKRCPDTLKLLYSQLLCKM